MFSDVAWQTTENGMRNIVKLWSLPKLCSLKTMQNGRNNQRLHRHYFLDYGLRLYKSFCAITQLGNERWSTVS